MKMIKNVSFSVLKTFAAIIIPFIVFPYISRVLSVDDIGKWNYASAVVSYFSLAASFGINEYATRNGAQIRDNKNAFELFADQIFSVNSIFSAVSFCTLLICALLIKELLTYRWLLMLLGINVLILPLSLDWLFNVMEDFKYISIRSITIQIIATCCILAFVKQEGDLYKYAIISVAATTANIAINYLHARSFYLPKWTLNNGFQKHFNNLKWFFINSLASMIYLNSDIILLGIICNDYSVGLYSASSKIYSIVKQLFNAAVFALIPRLSFYASSNDDSFRELLKKVISIVFLFVVPATIGLFLMRYEVIYLVAGKKYIEASRSLGILSFATFFAVFANIFVNGIMISRRREKLVVFSTLISALLNIALNIVFIRYFAQDGAAATTLFAEAMLLIINVYFSRDVIKDIIDKRVIIDTIIATIVMSIVFVASRQYLHTLHVNYIVADIIIILSCFVTYLAVIILREKKIVLESLYSIRRQDRK